MAGQRHRLRALKYQAVTRWHVVCASMLLLVMPARLAVAAPTVTGVVPEPCPPGAVSVPPGASIQAAVDRAGEGAAFCLKNGVHRLQVVRPRDGQSFHGEGRTVLNGSRLITRFSREERYWVASDQWQRGRRHGECTAAAPACKFPEGFFIDDQPLTQVLDKESVGPGSFYLDYTSGKLYFVDNPVGRKVEATVAAFAFESMARNVLIRNVTIEKYASVAQKGAIHGIGAAGWTIANCEVRLNSGAGIAVGSGGRVRGCSVHHNGQIGVVGEGRDIRIEGNRIWANNIYGFDYAWEAGGIKVAESDGIAFVANHVYDNVGPGIWCDIDCRNVVYEGNLSERNRGAGIFHEISFNARIHNNVARHNGSGDRRWFWGAEILIAASQDVEVRDNTLAAAPGGCGVILIDQGRRRESGGRYKTRNVSVSHNDTTFEGAGCAGGASDTQPGDENFAIITVGNNHFDANTYRVPHAGGDIRFPWGHEVFDWDGFRRRGQEPNGLLVQY